MKKVIALFVDGLSVPAKEGLTAHHVELAEHLASSERWRPLMVVADRDRVSHETLRAQPYDTVLLPPDDYYDKRKVAALLRRYNVAVAQNYNPHYFSTILAPAAREQGIPTLFEVHDYEKDLKFMNRDDTETAYNIEAQRAAIQGATHTRIMSKYDHDTITAEYDELPKDRITWLPFGAKRSRITRQPAAKQVLFIGNSSYLPNAEACRYIIEELAPRMPDVSFHLVGRHTDTFVPPSNVTVHGEVEELRPRLEETAVGIAPIAKGSGMKIKLLTYLSAGIPCVATSVAMAGFPRDEKVISVADDIDEFVAAIYTRLSDRAATEHVERYFAKYFDSKTMFAAVERMYDTVFETPYSWHMPPVGEFDQSRLHWLKEAANLCFGKTVSHETYIQGQVERFAKPLIVIEGLPGAGKTSLMNALREDSLALGFVEEVPFPISGRDEEAYFQNDILKCQLAETMLADCVVMDRNYCSTLAYAYAESKVSNDRTIYENAEAWVIEQLAAGNLHRPDAYVYIKMDPGMSVGRRNAKSADWNDEAFARYAAEWYDSYFRELGECPVIRYDAATPTKEVAYAFKLQPEFHQLIKS